MCRFTKIPSKITINPVDDMNADDPDDIDDDDWL